MPWIVSQKRPFWKAALGVSVFYLSALFWRIATLPLRVPSLQRCLTALFGMVRGVTTASNHQNTTLKNLNSEKSNHSAAADICVMIFRFPNRNRLISTPRLNTLLCLHLVPINLVISQGPITIPNLGVGFPLRCFQRLSFPDIATERCAWRHSSQTRGQFISVLSY